MIKINGVEYRNLEEQVYENAEKANQAITAAQNVERFDSRITANASAIATNTQTISTQQTAIQGNAADISSSNARIVQLESAKMQVVTLSNSEWTSKQLTEENKLKITGRAPQTIIFIPDNGYSYYLPISLNGDIYAFGTTVFINGATTMMRGYSLKINTSNGSFTIDEETLYRLNTLELSGRSGNLTQEQIHILITNYKSTRVHCTNPDIYLDFAQKDGSNYIFTQSIADKPSANDVTVYKMTCNTQTSTYQITDVVAQRLEAGNGIDITDNTISNSRDLYQHVIRVTDGINNDISLKQILYSAEPITLDKLTYYLLWATTGQINTPIADQGPCICTNFVGNEITVKLYKKDVSFNITSVISDTVFKLSNISTLDTDRSDGDTDNPSHVVYN